MPNIIPPDKKPVSSVLSKVQQFITIKRQVEDLTKEQTQLKTFLSLHGGEVLRALHA